MDRYMVCILRRSSHKLPQEASNAEKYWRIYEGPLDEMEKPYTSDNGTFRIPDTTDDCLWKYRNAVIPLSDGAYIIRIGKDYVFWKYNGNCLVLEAGFDTTGIRRHPRHFLGKIRGSYDKCIHSTKRKQPSWRVLPTCPNPAKFLAGKRYRLQNCDTCLSCPSYQYDRSLERSKR